MVQDGDKNEKKDIGDTEIKSANLGDISDQINDLKPIIDSVNTKFVSALKVIKNYWVRWLIQSIVAGVVIAGSFLVLYPPIKDVVDAKGSLATTNAKIALAEAKLTQVNAEIAEKQNQRERGLLEEENKRIKKEFDTLREQSAEIEEERTKAISEAKKAQKRFSDLQKKYEVLASNASGRSKQAESYRKASETAKNEVASLRKQLEYLEKSKKEANTRIKNIDAEIATRSLKRVLTRIMYHPQSVKKAKEISNYIADAGGKVELITNSSAGLSRRGNIYYTSKLSRQAAEELNSSIKNSLKIVKSSQYSDKGLNHIYVWLPTKF